MSDGAAQIQGCCIRVAALDSTGAPIAGANEMWQDDLPFVKLELKPVYENGVDITPISACGAPIISYKDYDRAKRVEFTLTLGAEDFDRDGLIDGGATTSRSASTGRTVTDGVTTIGSNLITSATAAFVSTDVNRSVTGTGIPANTIIVTIISGTQARISNAATATGSTLSLVFGTVPASVIEWELPQLLTVGNPNGVSIEVWSKAIERGTGYQGYVPYPYGGLSTNTPPLQGSGYIRTVMPRAYPFPGDQTIEDKETDIIWTGWCIENPNWGTGPLSDFTTAGAGGSGGTALDSNRAICKMRDGALPSPRQAGLQTTTA